MFRELSVAEQRYRAVLAVIEYGLDVTEAAAKAGVTRQALHSWLNRYAEGVGTERSPSGGPGSASAADGDLRSPSDRQLDA